MLQYQNWVRVEDGKNVFPFWRGFSGEVLTGKATEMRVPAILAKSRMMSTPPE